MEALTEVKNGTELLQLDPTQFGLTTETAKNIQDQFAPMLAKMVELESEFNKVVALPIADPTTSKLAKELRLKYVKVRTGTAEIHKSQKAFFLNGGRFVDGWKSTQLHASSGKESALEDIENHQANLIKAALETLQAQRVELIRPFVEDTTVLALGTMPEDVWDAYFAAKKKAFEDAAQATVDAENARIEAEKVAQLHETRKAKMINLWQFLSEETKSASFGELSDQDFKGIVDAAIAARSTYEAEQAAIKAENERLAKEVAESEAKAQAERDAAAKVLADQQAKADAERKIAEDKAKSELDAANKVREAEAKAAQLALEAQQAETARVQAELQAKADADKKAEDARLAAIEQQKKDAEKAAKAPAKKQLATWVDSFEIAQSPVKHDKADEISAKFVAFKKWAAEQVGTI